MCERSSGKEWKQDFLSKRSSVFAWKTKKAAVADIISDWLNFSRLDAFFWTVLLQIGVKIELCNQQGSIQGQRYLNWGQRMSGLTWVGSRCVDRASSSLASTKHDSLFFLES